MSSLLTVLMLLMMSTTLACAQPAQDTPTPGQPGAPPTPEAQHQPRRADEGIPCELHLNVPGGIPVTSALTDACQNHRGLPRIITKVQCQTKKKGSLVFNPRLSGGEATSILARPLTCTTTPSVGVLNGQPRVNTFGPDSTTCVGACSLDFLLESVDGAEEAVFVIVGKYE